MNKKQTFNKSWEQDLVLIAKNTFVWMYQLSKKYNTQIQHLDQIPIQELLELRSYGINGLWLIGIWKRSPASRKIKELYGKEDCIASAYSIIEYKITENLGGDFAFNILKENAHKAGIKLGCDIVPNHTGIDSKWLFDHPDWYIQSDHNPSPNFNYNSPNLSNDPRAEIRLEQGYYTQTGAAEVFQYKDNKTGEIIFIYHGNDGTSMPWNDTAQLDYLKPEVRSAVRELIVSVAKHFDIIRFDAAMTLTKQHYKRLWFPSKDGEKFIPTRGSCNMDKVEFDKKMPNEFWIEALDDIHRDAPDTLLIAEAFWLMEGFFVNNLGMDRVYNSAFMNFLRNEQNKKFKLFLNDISNWDPFYMEHLVNYLSTPDEEPAVNQFRDKRKYIGVCMFLATFPGMPMFGHGQIEGYRERYGMDFLQPRFHEDARGDMITAHKLKIKPLLDSRGNFSGSKYFKQLDYFLLNNTISDIVIAFTNKNNNYVSVVILNNSATALNGFLKIPFSKITSNRIRLVDFYSKEYIETTKNDGSWSVHLPLLPYECKVFEVNEVDEQLNRI